MKENVKKKKRIVQLCSIVFFEQRNIFFRKYLLSILSCFYSPSSAITLFLNCVIFIFFFYFTKHLNVTEKQKTHTHTHTLTGKGTERLTKCA